MQATGENTYVGENCYSYVGFPKNVDRKFLIEEALKLGLVPKIHYHDLKAGNPVALKDGSIVHPDQVFGELPRSTAFMFSNIPDLSYLDSFLDQNTKLFQDMETTSKDMGVIYHSVPLAVLNNKVYRTELIKRYPDALHVIDCIETNHEESSRVSHLRFAKVVK